MNLRKIEHNEIVNKVTDASVQNKFFNFIPFSCTTYVTVLYTATKEWIKTDCELQDWIFLKAY